MNTKDNDQPVTIDWKHLYESSVRINAQVVRISCDSILRNIDDPKRVRELIKHLRANYNHIE